MRKILITGGCGFIGSNFVHYLFKLSENISVCNLDCLTYAGNLSNLEELESLENYKFIKGDIRDKSKLQEIFAAEKPNIVINFAAETHVDRSIHDPNIFVETNVLGTQNLIEVSTLNSIDKFIQISTDEVYGELDELSAPFTEKSQICPSSPYSASKASADLLLLAYHRTFGFPVVITRCSNNYGKYQYPEKLIPLVIQNAFNEIPIPIYGDGSNVRDWINVDDHCNGIYLAMKKGIDGNVYNFGGMTEISNLELVRKILKLMNKEYDLINFVEDRPGHDYRYAINCDKAIKDLEWLPQINFNHGLRNTIDWYNSNKEWFK